MLYNRNNPNVIDYYFITDSTGEAITYFLSTILTTRAVDIQPPSLILISSRKYDILRKKCINSHHY